MNGYNENEGFHIKVICVSEFMYCRIIRPEELASEIELIPCTPFAVGSFDDGSEMTLVLHIACVMRRRS